MSSFHKSERYLELKKWLRDQSPLLNSNTQITIIGAGLAGLCAGFELDKLGIHSVILESSPHHIGGRVRTYRDKDGSYCEFGAMRIPKSHSLTRDYVAEMGLELRQFIQDSEKTYFYIRGIRVRRDDAGKEELKRQFNLPYDERSMSVGDMWQKAILSILDSFTTEEALDLFVTDPQTDKIKALDEKSLLDALKDANLSDEAIEYLTTIYGLETYLLTSLTEHLREEVDEVWTNKMDEIIGGTDLLADALYEHVKEKIVIGAQVKKCEKQESNYLVTYEENGIEKNIVTDWVICTPPLGALLDVDLFQCITPQQQKALLRVNYDSSIKVLAKCKRRFWEIDDGIYGGGSVWSGSLGHTWYPSDNAKAKDRKISNKPAYLLAAYTWGQHSRQLDALRGDELKEFVIQQLKTMHPNMDVEDVQKVIKWSWNNYSGSVGAFAFFKPYDHVVFYKHLKSDSTKFLFAGEHCSLTHSWMQGAFESALDACYTIYNRESINV